MIKKWYLFIMVVFFVSFFASNCIGEPLSPKLCKAKVKAASKLLKEKGRAAFDTFKDPKGEFRFGDGAGYVWVHDLEGIMLVHPVTPSLNGKALFGLKDVNGVYFFVAFNEMVEEHGAGWVPYSWPKPGEEKSSPKISYVELVMHGGNSYIVGSGMYDVTGEDIKKAFPNDPVYEY